MANTNYIFLSPAEARRGTTSRTRQQANRHVQLKSSRVLGVPQRPSPYTIRFRISQGLEEESESTNPCHPDDPFFHFGMSPQIDVPLGGCFGSPKARIALEYYREVVTQDFSEEITNEFWQVYLLQRSCQEGIIRDALVALGHVHRWRHTAYVESQLGSPVDLCGMVLSGLRSYIESPHVAHSTVIACAIILATIQELLDDPTGAALHMDNAIAMLNAWGLRVAVSTPEYDTLRMRLIRHDIASTAKDLSRPLGLPSLAHQASSPTSRTLRFNTIEQLDAHLIHHIGHPLFGYMRGLAMRNADAKKCQIADLLILGEKLRQWARAADDLKCRTPNKPSNELGFLLVKGHYLVCKCQLAEIVQRTLASPTMTWDHYGDAILEVGCNAIQAMSLKRQAQRGSKLPAKVMERGRSIPEVLQIFASKASSEAARTQAIGLAKRYATM